MSVLTTRIFTRLYFDTLLVINEIIPYFIFKNLKKNKRQ